MEIKKELEEVIKKNLPAQVGELLQKELQELELLRGKMKLASETIQNMEIELQKKDAEIEQLGKYKCMDEELNKRGKELDEREQKMEVETLKVQLDEANKRADMAQAFTQGLVRNTIFREDVLKTRTTKVTDHNGFQQMYTEPDNSTTTKQQE